jgi:hypothetical protein
MQLSKTSARLPEAPAKVPHNDKVTHKKPDEERDFLAKTLGELLAWYWWKTTGAGDERKENKLDAQ